MTKIEIVFLVVYASVITADVLKGFHFNSDRKEHFQIPRHEMDRHASDPNSTWMFDFQNHGNCLRLDVKPFKLPSKWTACYKSNHDYVDAFVFLSLISTKSGNSVVDDFKNNT